MPRVDQPQDAASEINALDPEPIRRKLSTGLEVEVVRLRTRQFFRLLKVLTHGAGNALLQQSLDFSLEGEEFARRLISMVLISIPDAEGETIDFIQSMVKPTGLPDKPLRSLSKAEREDYDQAWADLAADLYNPELDDLLDIVSDIVRTEAPHLQELGKRVASLLELATKTGQDKPAPADETPSPAELDQAQEGSPPPSTSSAASTGGEMSESSTSPSAGSSRSRRPSAPAVSESLSSAYV